ncbi:MAG: alanine racemase [Candidatus Izimaplasma sp.]|nr:alanine racemase [Candidatus Izimaplasma bacterium]
MSNIYRKTYAKINLKNIVKNYERVSHLIPDKTVIPVVKADAYGHGAREVTGYLKEKGVTFFCVSLLEEALELRNVYPEIDILTLGVITGDDLNVAAKHNIKVTISNHDQLLDLLKIKTDICVHLKIDTGMNRLGFKNLEEIPEIIKNLTSYKHICLEGIYTHFATADNNKDYYDFQYNKFKNLIDTIDYEFDMIHISNSSSSIKYEQIIDFTTHVRLGISLYGLTLDKETTFLENTFQLVSHIQQIKKLKQGEKVGYGATYTAKEDQLIGVLPIGYADGVSRQNNPGDVEINHKRYPIVGRICMDQMFIKIDESVSKQDDCILFGGLITIDEVAKRLHTINYEIICMITKRVPRVYKR